MKHDVYDDSYIRSILTDVKSIAMVGASPVNVRPSYFAFKYLVERGYDMIPINPGQVGKSLIGKPFVGSLKDIDRPVDMVDIFRNSEAAGAAIDEAIAVGAKSVWTQLDVINAAAAERAEAAGLAKTKNSPDSSRWTGGFLLPCAIPPSFALLSPPFMTHAVLSLLKESRHPMRIDLIGVAGSGMSGLALLLLGLGMLSLRRGGRAESRA